MATRQRIYRIYQNGLFRKCAGLTDIHQPGLLGLARLADIRQPSLLGLARLAKAKFTQIWRVWRVWRI